MRDLLLLQGFPHPDPQDNHELLPHLGFYFLKSISAALQGDGNLTTCCTEQANPSWLHTIGRILSSSADVSGICRFVPVTPATKRNKPGLFVEGP